MAGGNLTGPQPGGLLDRFLARLIDGILVGIVYAVIVLVILGAIFSSGDSTGFYGSGQSYAYAAVAAIISAALYLGYFAYMESSRGQTVGKMLMKLHTQGPDGGKPTMEQALRRNAWSGLGILGVIPFFGLIGSLLQLVAVIMIAVGINGDPVARQAWHDKFAGGTRVIKAG